MILHCKNAEMTILNCMILLCKNAEMTTFLQFLLFFFSDSNMFQIK